jgi:hypothetical protein
LNAALNAPANTLANTLAPANTLTPWLSLALGLALGALSCCWASAAAAQEEEDLFPPDNPSLQQPEPQPEPQPSPKPSPHPSPAPSADSDADGEEDLFLPDNPAQRPPTMAPPNAGTASTDSGDEEDLLLPDNPRAASSTPTTTKPNPKPAASPGLSRVGFFKGQYTALTSLDTSFDGDREDIWELYQRLDLGVRYDASSFLSAQLEGRLMHWYGVERALEQGKAHYEATLREALVRLRWSSVTLTLGNQFILWGAMDLLQPSQAIHPTDARYLPYTPGTAALLPRLGAELKWFVADATVLSFVWLPFFEPGKTNLWGNDFALAQPGSPLRAAFGVIDLIQQQLDPSLEDRLQSQLGGTQLPEETLLSSSLGARVTTTQANIDLSLGYLWGWDPTPTLYVSPDLQLVLAAFARNPDVFLSFDARQLAAQEPDAALAAVRLRQQADTDPNFKPIDAHFDRRHVLQADATTYLGPIGVRAEAVFSPSQTAILRAPPDAPADAPLTPYSVRKPHLHGAFGLSWESSDGAHVISVEALYTRIFDLSDAERLLVQRAHNLTIAALLQTKPLPNLEDLTLLVTGRYNAILHDFTVFSAVTYKIHPSLLVFLQHILFEGPDPNEQLTLGGLFDRRDQVSAGLTWTF